MTDDSERVVVAAVGVGLVLAFGGAAYAMSRAATPTTFGAFRPDDDGYGSYPNEFAAAHDAFSVKIGPRRNDDSILWQLQLQGMAQGAGLSPGDFAYDIKNRTLTIRNQNEARKLLDLLQRYPKIWDDELARFGGDDGSLDLAFRVADVISDALP